MPQRPRWYKKSYLGQGKSGLMPRGREHTVTPKMQAGWLSHGAVPRPKKPHRLRRKRKAMGSPFYKLRTPFESISDRLDSVVWILESIDVR